MQYGGIISQYGVLVVKTTCFMGYWDYFIEVGDNNIWVPCFVTGVLNRSYYRFLIGYYGLRIWAIVLVSTGEMHDISYNGSGVNICTCFLTI